MVNSYLRSDSIVLYNNADVNLANVFDTISTDFRIVRDNRPLLFFFLIILMLIIWLEFLFYVFYLAKTIMYKCARSLRDGFINTRKC